MRASVVNHHRDKLGEGPVWDTRDDRLLRVDITGRRVIHFDPVTGETSFEVTNGDVSAVILCEDPSHRVLSVEQEIVLVAPGARASIVAKAPGEPLDNRFNDCRCDPQGRLWAGTMSRSRTPGTAALYRLETDGLLTTVLHGTTISNGLGWSPDGDRMYFVDSPTQRIDVLDFDGATGTVSNRRCLVGIPAEDGLPDGLAVDGEGCIWICLFGGSAVRRYSACGELLTHVDLPVTNPTCPAFGGPDLRTLYVTSARHRLTPQQIEAEPEAGALLVLDPGVKGLPANLLSM